MKLRGTVAARHVVQELELALGQRLHVADDLAVLTRATRLLLVGVVVVGALRDRLAVRHLRLAEIVSTWYSRFMRSM
jgi:hypothetical protein